MVHHIVLFKLKTTPTPELLDEMMMKTRTLLLKVPEVLSIKCGKNIDKRGDFPFFLAIDFDNMEKVAVFHEHPVFAKFRHDVIEAYTSSRLEMNFEMEPGKDVQFS